MIKGGLTTRYAKALYELAAEKQQVKDYQEQLHVFAAAMKENPDFANLLCGKLVSAAAKKQIIEQTFAGMEQNIKNLFFVMIDKNRESGFVQIVEAFDDLCDAAEGVQQIMVKTAVPLGDAEAEALAKSFEKKLGGKVRLKSAVDKSLIGGITVQIGDTVYDASIAQQLYSLQQTLAVE